MSDMNMDRFKFRVWFPDGPQENRMLLEPYSLLLNGDGGLYSKEDCCRNSLDEKCILMQCTGLRDKNGKLIYEGDIFLCGLPNVPCEVIYSDIVGQIVAETIYTRFPLFAYDSKEYEIIGNIYENPELMKNYE